MIVTNSGYAYYTLNELYLKNSAINTIFDDVQSIFQPDSPVQKSMFFMFKMHFGNCHINQPKGNDVIGVDDVLEIKQKIYNLKSFFQVQRIFFHYKTFGSNRI